MIRALLVVLILALGAKAVAAAHDKMQSARSAVATSAAKAAE